MNKNSIKISTNRSFGFVFFILFLIIAFYPLIGEQEIRIWSLLISLIFLTLGLMKSKMRITNHATNRRDLEGI